LIGKTLDHIFSFMALLAALLLLFITFSIGYSIFTRQLGLPMPVWVVQFNEYALLWLTFLTTGWILARNKHVSVQILAQRLGRAGERTLGVLHNLVGAALCGVFCWYGATTTYDHHVRHIIDVGSIDFPKAIVLMIIPIGFFLLTLQFLRNLYNCCTQKPEDAESPSPSDCSTDREAA
jgi:C4-dicarboxylate transporter DctQ subunit